MQIVGYDTGDARLLVSTADVDGDGPDTEGQSDVDVVDLTPGTELAYTLGDRHCAGTIHDGRHRRCSAPTAPYCDQHTDVWVCARCTGTCLKPEMDCFDDHAVYLAAFAPATFKVGVTREWRLETRLREQGADRAAHVRTVPDGRIAREIEAELAAGAGDMPATISLQDRVRVPTKRRGLHRTVDVNAWQTLLEEFQTHSQFSVHDEFRFDYGLSLSDRPMGETMATGTVVGTKGRLLVLDREGATYAVDMRDLVGYELEDGRAETDLQSSLGAFG